MKYWIFVLLSIGMVLKPSGKGSNLKRLQRFDLQHSSRERFSKEEKKEKNAPMEMPKSCLNVRLKTLKELREFLDKAKKRNR